MNKCQVIGVVSTNLVYTHNFNGEDYYAMMLDVRRTSNYVDKLHIFISKSTMLETNGMLSIGDRVKIEGELVNSSLNNHKDVSIVAKKIELTEDDSYLNEVVLSGVVSDLYATKELPKYNKKVKIMIVKQDNLDRNVTLKVSAWNKYADYLDANYKVGDKVTVVCRLEGKNLYDDKALVLHEGSLVTVINK